MGAIFKNSRIVSARRYGKAGNCIHHRPEGSVITTIFSLIGQGLTALNGGLEFKVNEAISCLVFCGNQEQIGHC